MDKLITLTYGTTSVDDIREYKKSLREQCRKIRAELMISDKTQRDEMIFSRIISSKVYQSAEILLTYVSTEIEVDTKNLIIRALEDKKRVAVPRCIDGTRDMDFYFIKSMDDLESGSFRVLEPIPDKCLKATELNSALCIIPGLAFDLHGYRLGYGKGYYDRFLSAHKDLIKLGICYCSCTCNELIHGRFDIAADMLITEKYCKTISRRK